MRPKQAIALSYVLSTVCIILLSFFVLALLSVLLITSEDYPELPDTYGSLGLIFAFIYAIILAIHGIRSAKRMRARGREYSQILGAWVGDVHVSYAVSEKEYLKNIYLMIIQTPSYQVGLIVLSLPVLENLIKQQSILDWYFAFFLFLLLVHPLLFVYRAQKAYRSTEALHENINLTLTDHTLIMQGESFEASKDYTALKKIVLTKEWMLIYTQKQMPYSIPLKSFTDPSAIGRIKLQINYLIHNRQKAD